MKRRGGKIMNRKKEIKENGGPSILEEKRNG
jgi:hypothetical protein